MRLDVRSEGTYRLLFPSVKPHSVYLFASELIWVPKAVHPVYLFVVFSFHSKAGLILRSVSGKSFLTVRVKENYAVAMPRLPAEHKRFPGL